MAGQNGGCRFTTVRGRPIPCVDIPSLTTVVLSDRAFSCKKDIRVHSRVTLVGLSADVSEALLHYLSSVSCKDMGC